MPDKFKRPLQWVTGILVVLGVALSYPVFRDWRVSMAVAVALVLLQLVLNRTIFEFLATYVQPMPDFELEPEAWVGMGYAFPDTSHPQDTSRMLDVVGPAFSSEEYASKFFELLREWNYGGADDRDDNICVSLIFEGPNYYSVYIYPNPKRQTVATFFDDAKKRHPEMQPHELLVLPVLVRGFTYAPISNIKLFTSNYTQSKPVWLKPFWMDTTGAVGMFYNVRPILKHHFRIRNRSALTPNDYEYAFFWQGNKPRGPKPPSEASEKKVS